MSSLPISAIVAWLGLLVDWSIRWGLVLAALAVWFALRPPRRAAIRYALCAAGLGAGLILPVVPRWAGATVVWPAAMAKACAGSEPASAARTGSVTTRTVEAATAPRPGEPSAHPESLRRRTRTADPVRVAIAWIQALGEDAWQLTALILAVIWVMSFVIFSARLVGGWLFLATLRRGASKVSEASISIMNECRQAVRLSRPHGIGFPPGGRLPRDAGRAFSAGPRAPRLGRLARIATASLPASRIGPSHPV